MPLKNDYASYFPIKRRFFSHPFWKEKRTFSKSEAWLDLMQAARFEESQATELIGGKLVSWSRGQLPGSLRFLADRWNWSKNKVDDFLKLLEEEEMVTRFDIAGQTIITLCNYEFYNAKGQRKGHKKGQQNHLPEDIPQDRGDSEKDSEGDSRGTVEGQPGDKTNKVNNGNTEEEVISGAVAPINTKEDEDRFKAFKNWIDKNAPNVAKMKEPFTIEQYKKLRDKLDKNLVQVLLLNMHNYKPLLQKNISSYLTILNWSKREEEKIKANGPTRTGQGKKLSAAIKAIESEAQEAV